MPDIDYGQILEALNDKVDLSGSWSAPTSQYDDLTLGSSGESYLAPSDGYFVLEKVAGVANAYAAAYNTQARLMLTLHVPSSGNYLRLFIPAKKGQNVRMSYNATGNTVHFYFVYAQKTN